MYGHLLTSEVVSNLWMWEAPTLNENLQYTRLSSESAFMSSYYLSLALGGRHWNLQFTSDLIEAKSMIQNGKPSATTGIW